MAKAKWSRVELRKLEVFATALVETCVRDSQLEQLHAGITPDSQTGDLSDVKVVSPYGEIPWTDVSRISDDEMRDLMIEVVDRVFTFLRYPEDLVVLRGAARWNRPRLDPALMRTVRRRQAAARGR